MPPPSAPQLMIRPARELAGISLRELARRIGVSVGTMSGIETGKTTLSDERFAVIADALDTTPAAIAALASTDDVDEATPHIFDWREFGDLDLDPVLQAAIDCFVATGFHGATMRTVAAAAGISVPGVYHHYPNKHSLLVAVFELASAELGAHLRAALDDHTDPVDRLTALAEATTLFATRRRAIALVTITDRAGLQGAAAEAADTAFTTLVGCFRQAIVDSGATTAISIDAAATARAATELCLSVCRWFTGDAAAAATVARDYAGYVRRLAGHR